MPTESIPPAPFATAVPPDASEVFAFPTTVGQKRFWALDGLQPGNPALNMPLAARLQGRLDREAAQSSVNEVFRKHEALRCSFETENDDLVQVVHPARVLPIRWIDATDTPVDKRKQRTEELALDEGSRSFNLRTGPLLRAAIATFAPDEHLLMLTMHHIASDGWSNGILIREFAENYTRVLRGGQPPFEDLPLQYGDFAVWQKDWLGSPAGQVQRAHWEQTLGVELPVLNLPTDRPRTRKPTIHGTIHSLLLGAETAERLKRLCQQENATPFMGYLAAYIVLLHRYSGRDEFVVGSPAACRNQTELEGIIGLFANPVLIRPRLTRGMTFRQVLHHVREVAHSSLTNQEFPFEILAESLRTEPTRRGVPWLQAYFVFQRAFMQPQSMPDLELTPLRSISPGAMFEWLLGIIERQEGVRLQLEFNTDLFDSGTIDRALEHLERIVVMAGRNADFPIDIDLDEPATGDLAALQAWLADPAGAMDDGGRIRWKSTAGLVRPALIDRRGHVAPTGVPGRLSAGDAAPQPADPWLRMCHDGTIEWLGHEADLARSPGFTLELAHLRATASLHHDVASAIAVYAEQPHGAALVLHVTARAGRTLRQDTIAAHLADRLPVYMQPAAIVVHDQFPRDAHGRVDFENLRRASWIHQVRASAPDLGDARPANETESKLAHLFAELLRLPNVDVRRSFFDLGGHSLLGVKLFARIEQNFGVRLPLALLLSRSSVRAIAERLSRGREHAESWSSLVPVQTEGDGPRFFCVHGAGGNILLYRDLARHMAPAVRFFGLQARGLDGRQPCLTRVEDMAAVYLEEIMREQPRGPYFIGGYCLGGNIAFEIARLITEMGESVAMVALLDTYNLRKSTFRGTVLDRSRIWAQRGYFHLDTLLRLSGAHRRSYVREKLRMARELGGSLFRTGNRDTTGTTHHVARVQRANHEALEAHDPRPIAAPVTLFAPRINYYTFQDPRMGWGDLVERTLDRVQLHANPHAMLLEPFVAELAGELVTRIASSAPASRVAPGR